jgi:hypothetical protein
MQEMMYGTASKLLTSVAEGMSLPEKMLLLCKDVLDSAFVEARASLDAHNELMLKAEQRQVFTINHYYEQTLSKIKEAAKDHREKKEAQNYHYSNEEENKKNLKNYDGTKIENTRLEGDHGLPEGFIENYSNATTGSNATTESVTVFEIQLSLHVYCKVLMKRILDHFGVLARHALIYDFQDHLTEMLSVAGSDELLERALSEDVSTATKRATLEASIRNLVDAQKKLKSI